MIRRTGRHLLELLAAIMAILAVLIAVAAWVLSRGPLPLTALTPAIEERLGNRLGGLQVSVGSASLEWQPRQRALYVTVTDARFREPSGREIIRLPRLRMALSGRGLIRGRLAPVRIELSGARAILLRSADGRMRLGFSEDALALAGAEDSEEQLSDNPLDLWLRQISGEQGGSDAWSYLTDLLITDANLTFFDARTQTLLHAPSASLEVARRREGLRVHLRAGMDLGGHTWSVAVRAAYRAVDSRAAVDVEFDEIRLSRLAATIPALRVLRDVDVPVRGRAHLAVDTTGGITSADLDLRAGAGRLAVAGFFDEAISVDSAVLAGLFNPETGSLELRRFDYAADGNRASFRGTANLQFDPDQAWRLAAIRLDLTGKNLRINIPDITDGTAQIDGLTFRGRMRHGSERLVIDAFGLSIGEARITAMGEYAWPGGEPALRLKGGFLELDTANLLALWPKVAGRNARLWLAENLKSGRFPKGDFQLDIPPGMLGKTNLPNDAAKVEFTFADAVSTYVRDLPEATEIRGRGTLWGNKFQLQDVTARIGGIRVSQGSMMVDGLHGPGHPGVFDVVMQGKVPELLDLLDRGPFGYPTRYGIDPATTSGEGGVRLHLSMPLRRHLKVSDIEFAVAANITDLSIPRLIQGMDLTEGNVLMKVNGAGLAAEGTIRLNGVRAKAVWRERFDGNRPDPSFYHAKAVLDGPARRRFGYDTAQYMSGPVGLEMDVRGRGANIMRMDMKFDLSDAALHVPGADWVKPAGAVAGARFSLVYPDEGGMRAENINLAGEDIAVRGRFRLAKDGRLLEADFPQAKLGTLADVSVQAERTPDNQLRVRVAGDQLDAGPVLEMFEPDPESGGGGSSGRKHSKKRPKAGVSVSAQVVRLGLANDVMLRDVAFAFAHDGRRIEDLQLSGLVDGKELVTASITRKRKARRTFHLYTGDAGGLLRGLTGTESIFGGKLDVTLDLDDGPKSEGGAPLMRGKVEAQGFRVVDVPVLARLLTLGSLAGLSELLQGAGISFERLDLALESEGTELMLKKGRAYGPSLGLTLEGRLNRNTFVADVYGTIVPAYSVNTVLGRIPLLGNLFVGRKGEGIIGITYRIIGIGGEAEIFFNPLSALAPGFLRRMFELGGNSDTRESKAVPGNATVPGTVGPAEPKPEIPPDGQSKGESAKGAAQPG